MVSGTGTGDAINVAFVPPTRQGAGGFRPMGRTGKVSDDRVAVGDRVVDGVEGP